MSFTQMVSAPIAFASTGVGKVNAAAVATIAIEHASPSAIIGIGTASAMNPDRRLGDVIVAEQVAQYDFGDATKDGFVLQNTQSLLTYHPHPTFFPAHPRLLESLTHALSCMSIGDLESLAPKIVRGSLMTGDRFAPLPPGRRLLWQQFSAEACDMESGAIAQICRTFQVPFLAIRGVSNTQGEANSESALHRRQAIQNALQVLCALIPCLPATL